MGQTTKLMLAISLLTAGCGTVVSAPTEVKMSSQQKAVALPSPRPALASTPIPTATASQAFNPFELARTFSGPTPASLFASSRDRLAGWNSYKGTVKGYSRWGKRSIGLTLDLTGTSAGQLKAVVSDTNLENGEGLQLDYEGGSTLRVKPRLSFFWKVVELSDPTWIQWAPILKQTSWKTMLDQHAPEAQAFSLGNTKIVGNGKATCLTRKTAAGEETIGFDPETFAPRLVQLQDGAGIVYQLVFDGYLPASR